MSKGVIYIATGDDFIEEASISVRQLKSVVPSVDVTLFCDKPDPDGPFDTVSVIEDPEHDYYDKITYMAESPYDKTVYLDTDIFVTEDFTDLFSLLDNFDIAAAEDQTRTGTGAVPNYGADIPESFPEYNTGVVAYNSNEKVKNHFDHWQEEYTEHRDSHPHDQPSFWKLLYESDLRIGTLPREYNCMCRESDKLIGTAKLFHGRLVEVRGPGAIKRLDIPDCAAEINSRTGPRVYVTRGNEVSLVSEKASLLYRLRESVRLHGIKATVGKAIDEVMNRG